MLSRKRYNNQPTMQFLQNKKLFQFKNSDCGVNDNNNTSEGVQKSHSVYIDWKTLAPVCFHGTTLRYWVESRFESIRHYFLNKEEQKCWITFLDLEHANQCVNALQNISERQCTFNCEFKVCQLNQTAADHLYNLQNLISSSNQNGNINSVVYHLEQLKSSLGFNSNQKLDNVPELLEKISKLDPLNKPSNALKLIRGMFEQNLMIA